MVWTEEMKAKAAATRAATKLKKEKRALRLAEKNHPERFDRAHGDIITDAELEPIGDGEPFQTTSGTFDRSILAVNLQEVFGPSVAKLEEKIQNMGKPPVPFDWETAPINEIITRQAEMKREYERISNIVLRRQNPPRQKWVCFTQENLALIRSTFDRGNSNAIINNCLKQGEDGRANFRDDGRFVVENGVRRLKPAFCCNSSCYKAYQMLSRSPQAR